MTSSITLLDSLYQHDQWANRKLLTLCDGLTDAQLDERRDIGFGTLRNTLFHILAAEEIWLERWEGRPWRPFETEAAGCSLADIGRRLEQVAARRAALLDRERSDGWRRICEYKNAQSKSFQNPLADLLWHVANHGIHHRAQSLNFLRQFGRRVPGGLDYIFYRLAWPVIAQDDAVAGAFRGFGLEVGTGAGQPLLWDSAFIRRYFEYSDWANGQLMTLSEQLSDAELDRPRSMGMDTMRRTITHLLDAETWWLKNWTSGPSPFEQLPETTSLTQIHQLWAQVSGQRNEFIATLDDAGAARIVTALVGAQPARFAVVESLVQLCGHGTHHRAQWVNMLRSAGATPPGIDVIVWLRRQV